MSFAHKALEYFFQQNNFFQHQAHARFDRTVLTDNPGRKQKHGEAWEGKALDLLSFKDGILLVLICTGRDHAKFCNQNADQLGYLAGLSLLTV